MIVEGFKKEKGEEEETSKFKDNFSMSVLLLQSVATSIDALSVGFTIAGYHFISAVAESLFIGAVTFGVCLAGIFIGRKAGDKLSDKATIFGGVILIAIGLEIFLSRML